jgi:amino acid permease
VHIPAMIKIILFWACGIIIICGWGGSGWGGYGGVVIVTHPLAHHNSQLELCLVGSMGLYIGDQGAKVTRGPR